MTIHFLACPTDVSVCVEVKNKAESMETRGNILSDNDVASTARAWSGPPEIVL